jgi:hypothetical protein
MFLVVLEKDTYFDPTGAYRLSLTRREKDLAFSVSIQKLHSLQPKTRIVLSQHIRI